MTIPRLKLSLTALSALALSAIIAVPGSAQIPEVLGKPSSTASPQPTQTSTPRPEPTEEPPPPPTKNPGGTSGGGSSGGTSGGGSSKGGSKPKGGSSGGGSKSNGASGGRSSTGGSSAGGSITNGSPARTPGGSPSWNDAVVVGPPSGGEGGFGLANWATRERSPSRTTTELLELLAKSEGRAPSRAELAEGFGRFPIHGYTWYQDDYGAPRFIGRVSLHAGVDLFADRGTPVAATINGYIWKYARGGRGGNALWLMGDDGVRYYYGHMDRFAFRPQLGRRLQRGEVFGFVGDTGSAVGTPPHVHFEVNPGGNGTVNPKEHLDKWLDDAIASAQRRLDVDGPAAPLPGSNAGWTGILELLEIPTAKSAPLWMLGLDPTSSVLLADDAINELLSSDSWEGFVTDPLIGATGPGESDPLGLGLEAFFPEAAHDHD